METITILKKDLVTVCDDILDGWQEYNHSDYGRHEWSCRHCSATDEKGPIVHELWCVYLVAQDLMTGINT
jgi:hypothetical protein